MPTLKLVALVVVVSFAGCPQMPDPADGGSGGTAAGGRAGGASGGSVGGGAAGGAVAGGSAGGTAGGAVGGGASGGSIAGGSAGGTVGGGSAGGSVAGGTAGGAVGGGASGGIAGGSAGGNSDGSVAFDAGRLNCTFEAPFDLGTGRQAQVAVLEGGETIYAWSDSSSVNWVTQSPTGTLGTPQTDVGGLPPGTSLVASGSRALLVYGTTAPELRARRYSNSTWSAGEPVPPTPQGLGLVFTTLEPSGAASIWRQDTYFVPPYYEATTDGTSAFASAGSLDAGFLYAARRANGTRLIVSLTDATSAPEVLTLAPGSFTRTPMPGAMVTGSDLFQAALADDGTAVVAGVFNLGSLGVGALMGSGGTFGAPQLIAPHGAGTTRTLGALAGPQGRGAVVWWDTGVLYFSRRTGTTWSAPQSLASTNAVVPRFTPLTAARGLLHYESPTNGSQLLELTVEGVVGAPIANVSPAYVSGTEYAGAGSRAAAIAIRFAPDGGYLVRGSQCR